jgi:hypothetical protein
MNCKSQLKRIAIQKGEAMPVEDNVREKFEAWLKEDTTIELDDELTDFAWYVWKAATADSAAQIAELEQKLKQANGIFNEIGWLLIGKGAPKNCPDLLLHQKIAIEKAISRGLNETTISIVITNTGDKT